MKKITIAIIVCCFFTTAWGQEVKFHSSAVENGIRSHLQIGNGANITLEQLDTITRLDLSGMGVSDIRDINMMPNLKWLDLSNNEVEEVYPLILLDSLEWIDLSFNVIENIDPLSCSKAKAITIDVTGNYIRDFSLFASFLPCSFTFEGAGMQETRNPPYFSIDELYCNSSEGDAVVYGRVSTNTSNSAILSYLSNENVVPTDGNMFSRVISPDTDETFPIMIINDTICESTYYVHPSEVTLEASQTVTVETGLPDNYSISLCNPAQQGSISVEGSQIVYTASGSFQKDEITFSYSVGTSLKGFSKVKFLSDGSVLLGDANGDGSVSVADVLITVDYVLGNNPTGFVFANANVSGDNDVTLADITGIVDIVLNQTSASIPAKSRESVVDAMALTAKGSHCALHLDNREPCRGISFTVTLPEGGTMGNLKVPASRADGHFALANAVAPGRYNVVVYGNSGKPLRDDATAMLLFDISGCQASDITVGNIQMVNDRNETILLPATYGIATGIAEVEGSDGNDSQPWYNTVGVGYDKPTHGVNIHNGKKTGVK